MSLAKKLNDIISGGVSRVKSDYGYFKRGVRESIKNDPTVKAKAAENKLRIKNIKEGNSEENLKLDKN